MNEQTQTEPSVSELTQPPAAPEKKRPPARAARVTGGVKPTRRDLVSGKTIPADSGLKAKTVAKRGGKAIGAKAAKRKAQQESKPVARPKGAQNGFTADGRIKRLKTLRDREKDPKAKPGSERHNTFKLYRDNMTVAEFVKAGGKLNNLKRDVKFKHVAVTKG